MTDGYLEKLKNDVWGGGWSVKTKTKNKNNNNNKTKNKQTNKKH